MSAMKHLLPKNLDELSSDALRTLVQQQAAALAHHEQVVVQQKQALAHKDEAIKTLELINSKLKYELAVIRRYRFGQKSEQYSGTQGLLFEEDAQADLVAIENELDALNKTADSKTKAPAHVIDKGLASHRLLAHVLVAKYADHLPLYRQQKRFAREGITLPLFTLADWVGQCGHALQPLVDALRSEEHTSELQSRGHLVCRLLLEKKKICTKI